MFSYLRRESEKIVAFNGKRVINDIVYDGNLLSVLHFSSLITLNLMNGAQFYYSSESDLPLVKSTPPVTKGPPSPAIDKRCRV